MESGKRKEPEEESDFNVHAKKDATEEEVEEFFAILRRIHVAVKYSKDNNGVEKVAKRWKPAFEIEDFEVEANGVIVGEKTKEENKGLDLNVGPEKEDSSV